MQRVKSDIMQYQMEIFKNLLFNLFNKQKYQIKSREKMNQGLRSKDKGARIKVKG